jgi:small-conductance mechanosensitive channel
MATLLERTLLDNSVELWLLAAGLATAMLVILSTLHRLLARYVPGLTAGTRTAWDDFLGGLVLRTPVWLALVLAVYAASLLLTLPLRMTHWLGTIVLIALLFQAALWGNAIISFWIRRYKEEHLGDDAASVTTANALSFVARLVLFALVVVLALDNVPGVEVTALIASLGIGGVAVALAVQNILADLLASLSITLDKPFMIGDHIVIGDLAGTVEHIGLKTTRLRSVQGEQLIFANSDLLTSRIHNYKRMGERRVVFSLGVTYETPYAKLAAIPDMLREIVEAQPHTRFDRAHFNEYTPSALNFEVVYYVLEPDYQLYMDIQQAINLAIFKRFGDQRIRFAYPTQMLYFGNSGQESTPALVDQCAEPAVAPAS